MNDRVKRIFLALCEVGNISKAAEQLYISRQSLSVNIRHLEEELGVPLFIRKKEGVELTKEGQQLRSCLNQMSDTWNRFLADIHPAENGIETIRIGLTIAFDINDLGILYQYEQQLNNIRIQAVSHSVSTYLEMMHAHTLDMFFSTIPFNSEVLESRQLTNEEMVLLLSENHPLAQKATIDFIDSLRDETFLVPESEYTDAYRDSIHSAGKKIEILTNNKSVLQLQLLKNSGVYLSIGSVADRFLTPGVVKRTIINSPLVFQAYLVTRRDLSPAAGALVELVAKETWLHEAP